MKLLCFLFCLCFFFGCRQEGSVSPGRITHVDSLPDAFFDNVWYVKNLNLLYDFNRDLSVVVGYPSGSVARFDRNPATFRFWLSEKIFKFYDHDRPPPSGGEKLFFIDNNNFVLMSRGEVSVIYSIHGGAVNPGQQPGVFMLPTGFYESPWILKRRSKDKNLYCEFDLDGSGRVAVRSLDNMKLSHFSYSVNDGQMRLTGDHMQIPQVAKMHLVDDDNVLLLVDGIVACRLYRQPGLQKIKK